MIPLKLAGLPEQFGLANLGASCHFNALLQALASCPAFLDAAEQLDGTATARALAEFARAARRPAARPGAETAALFAALLGDIRLRRPRTRYGRGQQSATEGLALLLEMCEPPDESGPVGRLFEFEQLAQVVCACGKRGSPARDTCRQYEFFHHAGTPMKPQEFSEKMRFHSEPLSGHACAACGSDIATRYYNLTKAPQILAVVFDQYRGHKKRYFPTRFTLGGRYEYAAVAQIEHGGSLHGGHYWATALRREPAGLRVSRLDDTHVGAGEIGPAATVYVVFYHFRRLTQ